MRGSEVLRQVALVLGVLLGSACFYIPQDSDGETGETGPETGELPEPMCGDGEVQAGEQCDDGNPFDDDACTASCSLAVCGDGYVHLGHEECDDGNSDNEDDCTDTCEDAECGDGFVQGVEECDDGNSFQDDACLSDCREATCGDGFVNEGIEQCDDGNLEDFDGCSPDCTSTYTCGDGVWEPQEECDDGNRSPDDGCSASCTDEYKRVFVSSSVHNGNLGGVAGADAICAALADDAGLQGEYLAWISSDTESPSDRFTHADMPYVLVADANCIQQFGDGGQPIIAQDWDSLTSGSLDAEIRCSETGEPLTTIYYAWTGTNRNGKASLDNCSQWMTSSGLEGGMTGGVLNVDIMWTFCLLCSSEECDNAYRLYCFEQ